MVSKCSHYEDIFVVTVAPMQLCASFKVMLRLFVFVFLLSAVDGLCQKTDTIRQYVYQTAWKSWTLTVRNNKTFFFRDNKFLDSLSGRLEKKGDDFLFVVDTSDFDKYQRITYSQFLNSVRLAFYQPFKAPIAFPSIDTARRANNRHSSVSSKVYGTYHTGNGFGGYGIRIQQNDTIAFYQWADIGGKEPDIKNKWMRKGDIVQVLGENPIASWITDRGRLYILPYFFVGKKTVKGKRLHAETYRYVVKGSD